MKNTTIESKQETRSAYTEKLRARLDRWNAELDSLEARAREAKADARIEAQRRVNELKRQRDDLLDKLGQLRDSGADVWQEMRGGIDEAWNALQQSFDRARSEIS